MFILVSTIKACVSVSVFPLSVCVPVGITSSAVRIKIYAIAAGIKKYKSIIKKHDDIVLLGKVKVSTIEVFISKASIDSYIIHDEIISTDNVLKEYNEIKQEIKNPSVEYII